MKLSNELVADIIKRAPHESSLFIARITNTSPYVVVNIMKKYNIKKLTKSERLESIEYIAYRHNIDIDLLKNVVNNLVQYKKPLPSDFSKNLTIKLYKKYGKPCAANTWNLITRYVTEHQLKYIIDNYHKFTNNTIKRDLNLGNCPKLFQRLREVYNLSKPERTELYCELCRVEHLPSTEYKSNTYCKKCWTKRMSEYQYVYYPAKKSLNE